MIRLLADLRKAAALGPRGWGDLVRAVAELAVARRRLARDDIRQLIGKAAIGPTGVLSGAAARQVERVAYAIVRMAARVPWRSDCLVQALAAQRWLARYGIVTQLQIGVRNDAGFAAHAWLSAGEEVVTGGPITGFAPLLDPGEQARARAALSGLLADQGAR